MRLIIVRHGETDFNKNGIMHGQVNTQLNKKGFEQVAKLAERLKSEKIDIIFTSDLDRAQQTAMGIAQYHKAPIIATEQLRERSHGIFDGKPALNYLNFIKKYGLNRVTFKPDGGESYPMVKVRAQKFLGSIMGKYENKTVLISSHGAFNRQLLGILLEIPIEQAVDLAQGNACLNIVDVDEKGKHEAKVIGCVKHL